MCTYEIKIIDLEGNFVEYYGQNKKADEMTASIAAHFLTTGDGYFCLLNELNIP